MRTTTTRRFPRLPVRLSVGLLLTALICIQFAESTDAMDEPVLVSPAVAAVAVAAPQMGSSIDQLVDLARTDHLSLLRECLDNYDLNIKDFTCRFTKRERIDGRLGRSQEIDVRFLDSPFSVAMHWQKNAPIGDRVLYVEGANDGKMLVRPKGLLSLVGTVRRQPDSEQVMANTLRPISRFGFRRSMESLIDVYTKADKRGHLTTRFAGRKQVDGRPTIVLERTLSVPRPEYSGRRTLIYIDTERLLPVCVEAWDWDDKLACRYIYSDVHLNVGLTSDDFRPKANGL
jgi:hypothetical protein